MLRVCYIHDGTLCCCMYTCWWLGGKFFAWYGPTHSALWLSSHGHINYISHRPCWVIQLWEMGLALIPVAVMGSWKISVMESSFSSIQCSASILMLLYFSYIMMTSKYVVLSEQKLGNKLGKWYWLSMTLAFTPYSLPYMQVYFTTYLEIFEQHLDQHHKPCSW